VLAELENGDAFALWDNIEGIWYHISLISPRST
jgi:hypothetical protein